MVESRAGQTGIFMITSTFETSADLRRRLCRTGTNCLAPSLEPENWRLSLREHVLVISLRRTSFVPRHL